MIIALSVGRDAPPELRARLAMDEATQRTVLRAPRPGVAEMVVLSTCHRTEIYARAEDTEADAVHTIVSLLPSFHPMDQHDVRFLRGAEAVEHLYRVASGLGSLVLGEAQILGQVRRALLVASEENAVGPLLTNVFSRAIRLGRRARSETSIGSFGASIGTLSAELLARALDGLDGRTAAVIGAGEAAGDAAGALAKEGARIAVLSRTADSARRLARAVGGTAHDLSDMSSVLDAADCGVVAVNGGTLVRTHHVPDRTDRAPLVLLDISMPPSVDIAGRSDVSVRTLEDLDAPRGPETTAAVSVAESMVRTAVADFERWSHTRASGRSVGDLRAHAEAIVDAEVGRVLASMSLSDADRARIEALGMRIANKLLHGPTVAMKEADAETQEMIRELFGLR